MGDQRLDITLQPSDTTLSSGGPSNAGETRLWALRDQAKQGFALAQYELALCYANCNGTNADKTKAAHR
jgi:TPR repeat protein